MPPNLVADKYEGHKVELKSMATMGVARIFQRGGHTVSNRGYSHFHQPEYMYCRLFE